jgi:predicted enzyme related to lactoylglutathione lyase
MHKPGSFCTAVLRTRNLDRSAAFYTSLIGWSIESAAGSSGHRLVRFGDKTVASLHTVAAGGDRWVPYVSVENIERTTEDARRLGATLVDAVDISGLARIATLSDPEGAVLGLWQPAPHQGAEMTDEVGSLWWIEMLSNNVAGARQFYQQLFGWDSVDTSFEPIDVYTVFKRGDVQEGGLLQIGKDWGVSPYWSPIFAVNDCDATLDRAKSLGGETVFVHTVPKHGRIGIFCDPGGAALTIRGPVPARGQA